MIKQKEKKKKNKRKMWNQVFGIPLLSLISLSSSFPACSASLVSFPLSFPFSCL